LRSDSETLKESVKNGNTTIAMFQIIDKAIDEQIKILDSIKSKAIQAATDGKSKIAREALQKEVEELLKELDNISKSTSFAGNNLLDGTFNNKKVHLGTNSNNIFNYSIGGTSSDSMGYTSYKTTKGGDRYISDLKLTFKNNGENNEDVTLSPFTLSSSAGKTIKDLANFVNKYSEETGVRAIYKEGIPLPVYKKLEIANKKKADKNNGNKELPSVSFHKSEAKAVSDKKINVIYPNKNSLENIESKKSENDKIDLINQDTLLPPMTTIKDMRYDIQTRSFTGTHNLLTPAGKRFIEDVSNGGEFNHNTLTLQTLDDHFSTFTPTDNIIVKNLPEYLRLEARRGKMVAHNGVQLAKELLITLVRKTDSHGNLIPIPAKYNAKLTVDGINLEFKPELFASKNRASDIRNIQLEYSLAPTAKMRVLGNFVESSANNGSVNSSVLIDIVGGVLPTIATTIDTNDISFNLAGLGPGFTQTIARDGNRLRATLTGTRALHGENNDVLLDLDINPTGDLKHMTSTVKTFVDFLDRPSIELRQTFQESSNNDGSISTSIVLKSIGDRYKIGLAKSDIAGLIDVHYASSLPANLAINYEINNSNEITVTYTRKAVANVAPITINDFTLKAGLFERGVAPAPTPPTTIQFLKNAQITVDVANSVSFRENKIDDGSISGHLNLNLPNGEASFVPGNIARFIDMNIPNGLIPTFNVANNNQTLRVSFGGRATDPSERIENFKIGFKKEAFSPNMYASSLANNIEFVASGSFTVDGEFHENPVLNNGTINNDPINLKIKGDDLIDLTRYPVNSVIPVAEYALTSMPVGYISRLVVGGNKELLLSLSGQTRNQHAKNVDMVLQLSSNIVKSRVRPSPVTGIRINYVPSATIKTIGEFKESAANNGNIPNKVTFELNDGEFIDGPIRLSVTNAQPFTTTAVRDTTNPKLLVVKLNGTATNHRSFNSKNIFIDLAAVIKGGANDAVGLNNFAVPITFVDPLPSLRKLYGNFVEDETNTGQVGGKVGLEIPLSFAFNIDGYNIKDQKEINKKTGLSLNDFLRSKITPSNLPYITETDYEIDPLHHNRLIVTFIKDGIKKVALNHGEKDSTSFRLNFKPSLFVGDKRVDDSTLDISFFDEPKVLTFGSFSESSNNDGSTEDFIRLNVAGDKFANVNPNSYINVKNIPKSLVPRFVKDGSSIRFYLDGNTKKHGKFDDLNDIELVFDKKLFRNKIQADSVKALRFDFKDQPILKKTGNFKESSLNDGSISNKVVIKLTEGFFKKNINPKDFVSLSKIPTGLLDSYKIVNNKTLEITLDGKAINHSTGESIKDSVIAFKSGLFESNIKPKDIENLEINFLGAPDIDFNGKFSETDKNDGSVSGNITLTLKGDTFKNGVDLKNYIILNGLPTGLVPKYASVGDKKVIMSFEGQALNHTSVNSVDNLSINFVNSLFTKNVVPSNEIKGIKVIFKDSPKLFANNYFRESSKNDGSIKNTILLDVFGDNLTSIDPNAKGVIKVKNLPNGLNPVFSVTKANQLSMQLIGKAALHGKGDTVNNLELEFSPRLFRNGVAPPPMKNLVVDFRNRPKLSTPDSFIESNFNDGTFDQKATFTLLNDTFKKGVDPNGASFINFLPGGLKAKFTILNNNQLELRFDKAALRHNPKDLVRIPELVLNPALFTNGISPEKFLLDNFKFVESPVVILSEPFRESKINDGSIENTPYLSVKNAKFNFLNIEDKITISNLPSGLTPVYELNSTKGTIGIKLVGKANKHTNIYDVKDLRIEFAQSLFDTGVSGNIINNGVVNFREPPRVSTTSFVESEKNDGSMGNKVTLTISDDKFRDISLNGLIKTSHIPTGLTPSFTRLDDHNIVFSLEGKANNHFDENDISNATVEFSPSIFESGLKSDPVTNLVIDFKDPPDPVVEASESSFKESKKNVGGISKSINFEIKYDTMSKEYEFKHTATIKNVKEIIGEGDYLLFNGINLDKIDTSSPNFYKNLVTRINNKGNGTGGMYAKLDGTDLIIYKDFVNSINIEGADGKKAIIANNNKSVSSKMLTKNMIGHFVGEDNLPKGLTPVYSFISKNFFKVTLEGNSQKHLNKHDVNDLKFTFKAGLFTRDIKGKDLNDVDIDFNDPTINFSGNFKESNNDDGSIESPITLELFGDTFRDLPNISKYISASNIPLGLTPSFKRLTDSTIEMSLKGFAFNHLNEHDVNNIKISMGEDLFTQGQAVNPTNAASIDFADPPDPLLVSGGPGQYGGYLTFISNKSNDLIIDSNGANFGITESNFKTTLSLRDTITKNLASKDLFGIGFEKDIDYFLSEGSSTKGLLSKQSSNTVLDAVDSALEYLRELRSKVASYQNKVSKRIDFLNITRTNLISAESRIREIDFAEETSNFQKRNLLVKAGNYAISQANATKKQILTLLQT